MVDKKASKAKKIGKVVIAPVRYPAKLVIPVAYFLNDQIKYLKKRKKDVEDSDPFKNVDRILDNAAPDADAEEQFGHAKSRAIVNNLERKIIQTRRALTRIKIGKYGICESCGEMIDTDRLMIYPEATLCVKCESKKEKSK